MSSGVACFEMSASDARMASLLAPLGCRSSDTNVIRETAGNRDWRTSPRFTASAAPYCKLQPAAGLWLTPIDSKTVRGCGGASLSLRTQVARAVLLLTRLELKA